MSEQRQLLADAIERPFRELGVGGASAAAAGFDPDAWRQIEELGLPLLLVAEADGGVGGDWEDAFEVLHAAGRGALPLPVGEAMLAARLLSAAGLPAADGLAVIAPVVEGGTLEVDGEGAAYFSGTLPRVPWGRHAGSVVACLEHQGRVRVLRLPVAAAQCHPGENCAGEPRDALSFARVAAQAAPCAAPEAAHLHDYAALLRAAQAAGAMQAALRQSIDYARERRQFGRAIGQFQAVQQQLALFGADTAAVASAARSACRAACHGHPGFMIGAAKLRANLAIGPATATAHQVHAAIGFTHEYVLRHWTQRLWAWRSEFGNDRAWSERLGRAIAARGAEHFWADLTAADDAAALA